jgi:hypothetical protein
VATINPVWRIWELPATTSVWGAGASGTRIAPPWYVVTISWSNVNSGSSDVCVPAPVGYLTDISIHIYGTTVTSVAVVGSNDNIDFQVLNDPQGNALTGIAAPKIEQILERVVSLKPTVTTAVAVNFIVTGRLPIT